MNILSFNIPLNIFLPIVISLFVLIILLILLLKKNKDVQKVLKLEKSKLTDYKKKLIVLENSSTLDTEKDFQQLNSYIRDFFKEYLNLNYSLTYLELEKIFNDQKKTEYANLCKTMSELDYTGEKSEKKKIINAIKAFSEILESIREN